MPSEEAWAQHKAAILDLYSQKSLKIVMETMKKNHDFEAT